MTSVKELIPMPLYKGIPKEYLRKVCLSLISKDSNEPITCNQKFNSANSFDDVRIKMSPLNSPRESSNNLKKEINQPCRVYFDPKSLPGSVNSGSQISSTSMGMKSHVDNESISDREITEEKDISVLNEYMQRKNNSFGVNGRIIYPKGKKSKILGSLFNIQSYSENTCNNADENIEKKDEHRPSFSDKVSIERSNYYSSTPESYLLKLHKTKSIFPKTDNYWAENNPEETTARGILLKNLANEKNTFARIETKKGDKNLLHFHKYFQEKENKIVKSLKKTKRKLEKVRQDIACIRSDIPRLFTQMRKIIEGVKDIGIENSTLPKQALASESFTISAKKSHDIQGIRDYFTHRDSKVENLEVEKKNSILNQTINKKKIVLETRSDPLLSRVKIDSLGKLLKNNSDLPTSAIQPVPKSDESYTGKGMKNINKLQNSIGSSYLRTLDEQLPTVRERWKKSSEFIIDPDYEPIKKEDLFMNMSANSFINFQKTQKLNETDKRNFQLSERIKSKICLIGRNSSELWKSKQENLKSMKNVKSIRNAAFSVRNEKTPIHQHGKDSKKELSYFLKKNRFIQSKTHMIKKLNKFDPESIGRKCHSEFNNRITNNTIQKKTYNQKLTTKLNKSKTYKEENDWEAKESKRFSFGMSDDLISLKEKFSRRNINGSSLLLKEQLRNKVDHNKNSGSLDHGQHKFLEVESEMNQRSLDKVNFYTIKDTLPSPKIEREPEGESKAIENFMFWNAHKNEHQSRNNFKAQENLKKIKITPTRSQQNVVLKKKVFAVNPIRRIYSKIEVESTASEKIVKMLKENKYKKYNQSGNFSENLPANLMSNFQLQRPLGKVNRDRYPVTSNNMVTLIHTDESDSKTVGEKKETGSSITFPIPQKNQHIKLYSKGIQPSRYETEKQILKSQNWGTDEINERSNHSTTPIQSDISTGRKSPLLNTDEYYKDDDDNLSPRLKIKFLKNNNLKRKMNIQKLVSYGDTLKEEPKGIKYEKLKNFVEQQTEYPISNFYPAKSLPTMSNVKKSYVYESSPVGDKKAYHQYLFNCTKSTLASQRISRHNRKNSSSNRTDRTKHEQLNYELRYQPSQNIFYKQAKRTDYNNRNFEESGFVKMKKLELRNFFPKKSLPPKSRPKLRERSKTISHYELFLKKNSLRKDSITEKKEQSILRKKDSQTWQSHFKIGLMSKKIPTPKINLLSYPYYNGRADSQYPLGTKFANNLKKYKETDDMDNNKTEQGRAFQNYLKLKNMTELALYGNSPYKAISSYQGKGFSKDLLGTDKDQNYKTVCKMNTEETDDPNTMTELSEKSFPKDIKPMDLLWKNNEHLLIEDSNLAYDSFIKYKFADNRVCNEAIKNTGVYKLSTPTINKGKQMKN